MFIAGSPKDYVLITPTDTEITSATTAVSTSSSFVRDDYTYQNPSAGDRTAVASTNTFYYQRTTKKWRIRRDGGAAEDLTDLAEVFDASPIIWIGSDVVSQHYDGTTDIHDSLTELDELVIRDTDLQAAATGNGLLLFFQAGGSGSIRDVTSFRTAGQIPAGCLGFWLPQAMTLSVRMGSFERRTIAVTAGTSLPGEFLHVYETGTTASRKIHAVIGRG